MAGKGKAGGITITGFKLHYRIIVGKKCYWLAQTHRPMNRMKTQTMNALNLSKLIVSNYKASTQERK